MFVETYGLFAHSMSMINQSENTYSEMKTGVKMFVAFTYGLSAHGL